MIVRTWTDDELIEAVKTSKMKSEVLRKLNLKFGGSYKTLDRHIKRLGLDLSHFLTGAQRTAHARNHIKTLGMDDLAKHKQFMEGKHIKRKILREGLLEYKCSRCGVFEWLGERLSLHLDHINGDNKDNRIENLRFLCPNCHSLTPTYCGKNIKMKCAPKPIREKYKQPTKIDWSNIDLKSLVDELGYAGTGRFLGVSDVAVRKHYMHLEDSAGVEPASSD